MIRSAASRTRIEFKEQTPWRTWGTVVLILAVAAVGAEIFWDGRDAHDGVKLTELDPAGQAFKPVPLVAPAKTTAASAPRTAVMPLDAGTTGRNQLAMGWRGVLETGTGLRAFVQTALKSPAQGGVFYAMTVAQMCARAADIPAPAMRLGKDGAPAPVDLTHAGSFQATQALQRLHAECSQFTPEELAGITDQGASARAQDPLVRIFDQLSGADDKRAALADGVLQRALDSRDPAVLHMLAPTLGVQYHPTGQMYLHLAGTDYMTAEQTDIAFGALALLPCSVGSTCDNTKQELLLQCLEDGNTCYANQLERVSTEFAQGDAEKLRAIQALHKKLVAAVQAGDVTAFLRKDKPAVPVPALPFEEAPEVPDASN